MREPLDQAMFANCDERPTPIRIGDKWTAKILICLRDGPRRFSELRVPLWRVTAKVLTESLRAMERDGLITRTAYPETPPRTEYELTALGHSLFEPMAAGCAWNQANGGQLSLARQTWEGRRVESAAGANVAAAVVAIGGRTGGRPS
jgi:DNA-binding HxlR family transcriptional regulator